MKKHRVSELDNEMSAEFYVSVVLLYKIVKEINEEDFVE